MANEYCGFMCSCQTGAYSPNAQKAMDYIMMHLGEPMTLVKIAEEIHVNSSYLSRKFKEEADLTVTEFIKGKRIEEAKLYLKKRNNSVTDLALMLGFNNLNYFSKVFKKHTGNTPTQYAENHTVKS